nr:MAG TPA: hypothetical protein [Caudoviricetes sp.]
MMMIFCFSSLINYTKDVIYIVIILSCKLGILHLLS